MLELLREVGAELTLCNGAGEESIGRTQAELGWIFPDEYAAFLRISNGAMGFLVSGDYLDLWGVHQIVERNRNFGFLQHFPEVIAFRSNGGGEAFVFRRANGFIAITPFVGMGVTDTVDVAPTFSQFLRRARPASWG